MYAERHEVQVTTDAAGAATAFVPAAGQPPLMGQVLSVQYVKDGTTPYSNGVGLAVTSEKTGQPILALASGAANMDASLVKYPRVGVHDGVDGAALLYAAGGTKQVDAVTIVNDRVQIVINAGGNTKTGLFRVVVG